MPNTIKCSRMFCGRNYAKCVIILLLAAAMTALVEVLFMNTNRSSSMHISQQLRKTHGIYIETQPAEHNGDKQIQFKRTFYKDSVLPTKTFSNKNMKIYNVSQAVKEFDVDRLKWCVPFYSRKKDSKICVYTPTSDVWVSGSIVKTGAWEKDLLNLTEEFQMNDPNLALLDIGCNIGVFTLFYSILGHNVVGIDANAQNLNLLSKSVSLNGLQDRVILINNAVSDIRQGVALKETSGNIGGTMVKAVDKIENSSNQISTIFIDDLIPFFKNQSVLIKIDIEGYEWKALNGSWEFFRTIDVKYVMMEYVQHRRKESGSHIRGFFARFGFLPYTVPDYSTELDMKYDGDWPGDMVWIKQTNSRFAR